MKHDVIIVGAGPTGLSLGVELGLLNIDTIILEKSVGLNRKHPKAQQLNPRTLQFFRRWGISQQLKAKKLLPDNYPIRYIWCSDLRGKIISSTDDMSKTINSDLSPENYLRIPLWLTLETLREKLAELRSVQLVENCKIINIEEDDSEVVVHLKRNGKISQLPAKYLVACDGADSWVRNSVDFETKIFPPAQKMLQIVFQSNELKAKITLPEATIYYNLARSQFSALSVFDGHLRWYADFACPETAVITDFDLPVLLDQMAGFNFEKTILYADFWSMQPLLAKKFRQQRIFLAGDAAHVLTPIGGHGLNTSVADAVNIAWKLAAALKHQASSKLLDSYEIERRAVALQKLKYVRQNTEKLLTIQRDYPLETMPEKFAEENQKIAEQMSANHRLVLGDSYDTSPIIIVDPKQSTHYDPLLAKAGYFAPHVWLTQDKCLYDFLSREHNLLVMEKPEPFKIKKIESVFQSRNILLQILNLDDFRSSALRAIYPKAFYLIRPDWHISWCDDKLPGDLTHFINKLLP